jgi:hypothetical protein
LDVVPTTEKPFSPKQVGVGILEQNFNFFLFINNYHILELPSSSYQLLTVIAQHIVKV